MSPVDAVYTEGERAQNSAVVGGARCPLGCEPVSRAERRRFDRDMKTLRPHDGVGEGWRLTGRGRWQRERGTPLRLCERYAVREHGPIDIDALDTESTAIARRLGCTCTAHPHEQPKRRRMKTRLTREVKPDA